MVYLRECNSSARLATVSIEDKLLAALTQSTRAFRKYTISIPNHYLSIFVSRCHYVPFDDWKFHRCHFTCRSWWTLWIMLQDNLTCSLIMVCLLHIKASVDRTSFATLQISHNDIAISVSCGYHWIVCVEAHSSATKKWLFINLIKLLPNHINNNKMAAKTCLQTTFWCNECNFWAIGTCESCMQDLCCCFSIWRCKLL